MNKNTVKLFVLASVLGGSISAFSQTPEQRREIVKDYDLEYLENLRQKAEQEYKENYAEALRMAAIKGWPLEKKGPKGEHQELGGITEDGLPMYYTTYNIGSAITSRANKLYPGGGLGLELTGDGMTALVWDGDHARISHATFGGRATYGDAFGGQLADHSTHVTGTVIGSGEGNPVARGIAYEANAKVFSWDSDTSEMISQATQGFLVSNHSYDILPNPTPLAYYGAYTSRAKFFDDITFGAPRYQPVVSAGNDRGAGNPNPSKGGYDLVSGISTSKNCVVVAAVNNVPNYVNANSVTMSDFSSWGPTDDNRIKPDISTKGVNVFSSFAGSDTEYGFSSGTSMSSPGIAGVFILLQQHYFNVNAQYMFSATLRALMAHTADEAGSSDGPDSRFGWGLMNAEKAALAITNNGTTSIVEELTLGQGQTYTRTVLAGPSGKLKATIAWTDRSGPANNSTVDLATPVLVNDLDIRITKNGEEYMPWKLDNMLSSAAIKGDNIKDNIEKIEIDGASGEYVITVSHKTPFTGTSQNFSLVVTDVDEAAGIADVKADVFSVWPNPANEVINISLVSSPENDASATLYDIQGRVVLQKKLADMLNTIDVQGLTPGMYVVNVSNGRKNETKKVIIN